jgi:hypothetical protein
MGRSLSRNSNTLVSLASRLLCYQYWSCLFSTYSSPSLPLPARRPSSLSQSTVVALLLLPPLSTTSLTLLRCSLSSASVMARKKLTGDELIAGARAIIYQRGAHRDEDGLNIVTSLWIGQKNQNAALDRRPVASYEGALSSPPSRKINTDGELLVGVKRRWSMPPRTDFPILDEVIVQDWILRKNLNGPDLATVKDFLRFQAATSKAKIKN